MWADFEVVEPKPPPQPAEELISPAQATIPAPNMRELNQIDFVPISDPVSGEFTPHYSEEKLKELRERKTQELDQIIRDRSSPLPKGMPGDEISIEPTREWAHGDAWALLTPASPLYIGQKIGEKVAEIFQDNRRDAEVWDQAREKGFSSLTEDQLRYAEENWDPERLQLLHATTADHGYELTEEAILDLAATQSGRGFHPEEYEDEEDAPTFEEWQAEQKEQLGVSDLAEEEIRRILGQDIFEKREKARVKEAQIKQETERRNNEHRKQKTVQTWDTATNAQRHNLSKAAVDTNVYQFLDQQGRVDFQELESQIVNKLANEYLGEEFPGMTVLHPDLPPGVKKAAYDRAQAQWKRDKALILSSGRGGIPFFDVDPGRTQDKIMEMLTGLESYPEMLVSDVPILAGMAKEMGVEGLQLSKVVDRLLLPMQVIPGGSETVAEMVRYNPATLPLVSATTPAYALDYSPTHRQFAARTTLDSLNSWYPTTWIAAAEKTNAEIIRGRRESGYVGSSEYADEVFQYLTEDRIAHHSGSDLLGEIASTYGGGPDKAGYGLLKLILSDASRSGGITTTTADVESAWEATLGAYNMAADFLERWVGATGDELNTRLMIRNLRQGNMLFMAHAEIVNEYATFMDVDDDTRRLLSSAAIMSGLTAEFARGTGADPFVGLVSVGGKGIQTVLRAQSSMLTQAKKLRSIRIETGITHAEKLKKAEKELDPAVFAMVKQNLRAETGDHRQVSKFIRDNELALERKREVLEDASREAGYEASPAILPGSRFLDEAHVERYIEDRVRGKFTGKDPSEIDIRAGRAKVDDFENIDEVIDGLEASGLDLPDGFRGWERSKQEQALRKFSRDFQSAALRKRAEREVAAEIASTGRKISEQTVAGDVYRLDGQAYMRLGARADDAYWIPVRDIDIPYARELAVTGELTTVTPLQPIQWKNKTTGAWINRPRGSTETPWYEVALERRNTQADILDLRRELDGLLAKTERTPEETTRLGEVQDLTASAEVHLEKLTVEETALRKTFQDYDVPEPRYDWDSGLSPEIEMILGDPGLWRSSGEMVGANSVSIRKPVLPPKETAAKALEAEAAVVLEEYKAAQVRHLEAEAERLAFFEDADGKTYALVSALRNQLVRTEKKTRKLEKKLQKVHEGMAPQLKKTAEAQKAADEAEAFVGLRKQEWEKTPTPQLREAYRKAEGKAVEALKELEKQAKELVPWKSAVASLQEKIVRRVAEKKTLEIFLLGSRKSLDFPVKGPLGHPKHPHEMLGRTSWTRTPRAAWTKFWSKMEEAKAEKPGFLQYIEEADVRDLGWRFASRLEKKAEYTKKAADKLESEYIRLSAMANKEARAHIREVQRLTKESLAYHKTTQELGALDRVMARKADEIEVGTRALRSMPDAEAKFNKALVDSTVEFVEGGGRIIAPQVFIRQMADTFNTATIKRASESGGQPAFVLKKILNESWEEVARVDHPGTLQLTLQESMQFQQTLPYLTRAFRNTHKDHRAITTVEALELAKRDPDLAVASFSRLLETNAMSYLRDVFDPIRREVGEVSSLVSQVVKGASHLQDHVRDEIYMIGRYVDSEARRLGWKSLSQEELYDRRARLHQRILFDWLTETDGIQIYRTRKTYFNTGDQSVWEQARHQLLNDPTTLGLKKIKTMAKAERSLLMRKIKSGELPKDTEVPSAKDIMTSRWGESVHGLAKEGDGQVLRALSRAFLPEGQWEGISTAKQATLYKLALKNLRATDNVAEFFRRMQKGTENLGFERYPNDTKGLQIFAYALAHGAIQKRANRLFHRAVSGTITPQQASDVHRLLDNTPEKIQDMNSMLEALNRIGVPLPARRVKPDLDLPEKELRLIATGADETGSTYFMPQAVIDTINSGMPNIVKDVTERFTQARGRAALLKTGADFEALSLWKTSVVTGLVVPRPTYFWNNFMGDLSQVWLNHGFYEAARMNKNLLHTVSLNAMETIAPSAVRNRFAKIHAHHVEKYGAERAQGSIFNAMFNPVANRVWRGDRGVLRTKGGKEYEYRELRHMMEQEGILDTMVHAELLETYHRVVPDRWKNIPVLGRAAGATQKQRERISSFATFIQQRQRGNLFMELIRQGKTPREAGNLVRESLYDWKHALSRAEVATIGKVSPFYRFWKVALKQVGSSILEPLIKPDRAMIKAMTGQTGLSRIRQQWATTQAWPQFWDPDAYFEYKDSAEKYDAMAKYLRPSWARMRAINFVKRNDEDRIRHLETLRGRAMDYSLGIMPPATALDVTELIGSISGGLLFWGLDQNDMAPWGGEVPLDWEERFFAPITDLFFPHIGDPVSQYLRSQGVDTGGFQQGQTIRINPGEKFIFDSLGLGTWRGAAIGAGMGALQGLSSAKGGPVVTTTRVLTGAAVGATVLGALPSGKTSTHPQYQFPQADATAAMFFRLTPLIGTELPALLDAGWFKNTEMQKAWYGKESGFSDYLRGIGSFVSTFSGIAKNYEFSPEDAPDYRQRDMMKQMDDYKRQMEIEEEPKEFRFQRKTPEELFGEED